MFGRRLLCLWGQFVGTYSALAYAAYAGWRGRERPIRCGFVMEVWVGRSVAQACPVRAYAVALIKVLQGVARRSRLRAEMTTWRLKGTAATPMTVPAWLSVSVPYRSMMSGQTATQTVDATNAAALAVDWALAQVGTPYIGAEKRRALDSTAPGSSKPPTAPPASSCPASPKTNTTPGRGSRPMKKL